MNNISRKDICPKYNIDSILENNIAHNQPLYILFNTDSGSNKIIKKNGYDHFIYGNLENSHKCVLQIENIPLVLDIELQTNCIHIEKICLMNLLRPHTCERIEIKYLKPFREYKFNEMAYARCYFKTLDGRKEARNKIVTISSKQLINVGVAKTIDPTSNILLYSQNYEVGSDEMNSGDFIYKFAKEYGISLSSWNILTNYKNMGKFHDIYYFKCKITDIHYATCNPNRMAIKIDDKYKVNNNQSILDLCKPLNYESIRNQSLLIMYFDIETYTDRCNPHIKTSRDIPDAKNYPDTDSVFIISCVFYWSHKSDPKDLPSFVISIFNTYGKFTKDDLFNLSISKDESLNNDNDITGLNRIKNNIFTHSEKDLLKEFMNIMIKMKPDIISGFNSAQYDVPFIVHKLMYYNIYNDFYNYCTCNPIIKYNQSGNSASKYTFVSRSIKLKADNFMEGFQINIPGILCIDTMQLLRRIYPDDEKYSLNYFLNKFNLGQKSDMEYKRLFGIVDNILLINDNNKNKILEEILLDIRDAIVYCEMDSALCYRLWAKENIILKYRSKAEMSFVNLNHALNRADGNKVINLVMANSPHLVFQFNRNIKVFDGKFTGAYVVDPKVRGLYTDKPVDELDVTSLYPSIMRAYNLSSEMISRNDTYMNYLIDNNLVDIRKLEIPVGNTTENGFVVFHQNKPEYKGVYVLILEFLMDKRKELKNKLKIVESNIKKTLPLREKVIQIINDNNKIDISNRIVNNIQNNDTYLTLEEIYKLGNFNENEINLLQNYNENIYQRDVADADQLTAKIFMNTFYGITGDKNGMFYELLVAASVTYFGQELLKSAHVLAKKLNYTIVYGDTDSMYISAPDELFSEIKNDYINNNITKEEYLIKMCYISKQAADDLMIKSNKLFEELTRTSCIKLSHDTTGFPSFWACKKKYCYLKQEFTEGRVPKFDLIEYDNENYKIKGLAIVTRGQTQILHSAGENIIYNMLYVSLKSEIKLNYKSDKIFIYYNNKIIITNNIDFDSIYNNLLKEINEKPKLITNYNANMKFSNDQVKETIKRLENILNQPIIIKNDNLFEIVTEQIEKIIKTNWKIKDFIQTATYRPGKDNKRINRFIERLKERNISTPEAGERFNYVIVKPKRFTNIDGSYIKTNVGDLMEFPDIAENEGREIYLQRYLNGSLKGMLSRFISYIFFERNEDSTLKIQIELNDEESIYIEKLTMRYATKVINSIIEYYSQDKYERAQEKLKYKTKYVEYLKFTKNIIKDLFNDDIVTLIDKIDKLYKSLTSKIITSKFNNIVRYIDENNTHVTDQLYKLEEETSDVSDNEELCNDNPAKIIKDDPKLDLDKDCVLNDQDNIENYNDALFKQLHLIFDLEKENENVYITYTKKPLDELLLEKNKLSNSKKYSADINKYYLSFIEKRKAFINLIEKNKISYKEILYKIYELNQETDKELIIDIIKEHLLLINDIKTNYEELNRNIQINILLRKINTYLNDLKI
jgi:DNA polymerase elongation subunit (family B)